MHNAIGFELTDDAWGNNEKGRGEGTNYKYYVECVPMSLSLGIHA